MTTFLYLFVALIGVPATLQALGTPTAHRYWTLRVVVVISLAGVTLSGLIGLLRIVGFALGRVSLQNAVALFDFLGRWGPALLQDLGAIALIFMSWTILTVRPDPELEDPRLEVKVPASKAGRIAAALLAVLPVPILLAYAIDSAFLTSYADVLAPMVRLFERIGTVTAGFGAVGEIIGFLVLIGLTIAFFTSVESAGCGCLLSIAIGIYLYWMISGDRLAKVVQPIRDALEIVF
jgi:hypothetical protein